MTNVIPIIKLKKASKHDKDLVTVSISDLPQSVRDLICTDKGQVIWLSIKPAGYRYSRSSYISCDFVINRADKTMAKHLDLAGNRWPAPDVGRPVEYHLCAVNATIRF